MSIHEAEWIVSEYEKGEKRFSNETVHKSYNLLEAPPYEKYECEFCDIEWIVGKIQMSTEINYVINVGYA
ncbi:hypothetical protein KQ41_06640 [Lysinibacillus fusiformis]|uniref:hypothetical protein n=1 Tax=Lysinibacillus fusiformis TaxID=28031 RepID=UPI0005077610|nr:hypothetical protein [Lysinibacillus fusiformis]KGA83713.1 hypothetical protein KQ41_06640 [Lysinibacillus fusiformis]